MKIIVNESSQNTRIDQLIAKETNLSRSYAQKLIENGNILLNDKKVTPKTKLKLNDKIFLELPELEALEVLPENIDLNIFYEDEDIIIINKPRGMVVHPSAGHKSGTLVNALLFHCKNLSGINGVLRPGIVHRIDKDTSGLLICAKNDLSHNNLSEQFAKHSIKREYMAITIGGFKEENGTINAPIARHKTDRLKNAVSPTGRTAITHYEVLERLGQHTLVKLNLETGRTHQIRVHMSYIKRPILGDMLYGPKGSAGGQFLHAKTLGFVHPKTAKYMEFKSELPAYFQEMLNKLRG